MGMKWFSHEMAGAPVLSGTAGSLINVLDACLITGFGAKQVQSGTVADGQAVLTVDNTNGYKAESTLLIEGVTGTCAALNGERRVVAVTANTITVKAAGVANGALDGTVTLKYAPAGWTQPFTDTNVAVYKQGDITATGILLRIDDTGGATAWARGFEEMSDANTGTGLTPTLAQISSYPKGIQWHKRYDSSGGKWSVFATNRYVYFCTRTSTTTYKHGNHIVFAGDLDNARDGDNFAWAIVGGLEPAYYPDRYGMAVSNVDGRTNFYCYLPRALSGVVGAVAGRRFNTRASAQASNILLSGSGYFMEGAYPTQEQALKTCDVYVYETANRGTFPKLMHIAQNVSGTFRDFNIIDGAGDAHGKTLMSIISGPDNEIATVLFDISE